ncbi:fasciclin domain-containing protein [Chamaesiphon sp. VAR_48_metabat_135_sub]|uniref:fasciclin domain-containing protein n=1 Tax=Chamaesiphon sp. VAR_48_metabat_135_sub TaxID=2964699 RepID=UPI00286D004C|nr:fasciclin domain-containing protein [Chamaesiphon sp. VAR_48_metabat_135_sub]
MSKYTFPKSSGSKQRLAIAATLGIAIVSAGIFSSMSSHAQNGTSGTTTTPTVTPTQKPSDGSMGKPDGTKIPTGGMSKPSTMPDGGMSQPSTTPTTTAPAGKTIVDVAAGNKSFTVLVKALKAANLVETLSGEGPYTVFAPTNEAFAKLPKGTLAKLLKPANQEQLKQILTYHVVSGAVTSKMLKSGKVDTVEGSQITVKIKGKKVMINNANVTKADLKTSNGVIHIIDRVIMPPTN